MEQGFGVTELVSTLPNPNRQSQNPNPEKALQAKIQGAPEVQNCAGQYAAGLGACQNEAVEAIGSCQEVWGRGVSDV